MKTAQIDVLSVQQVKDTFMVCYWDETIDNDEPTTVQLSEDALLDYIVGNDLNREEYIDMALFSYDCDGLSERYINPVQYLEENRDEVIKDYITANS